MDGSGGGGGGGGGGAPAAPPSRRSVRAASYDASTLTALDQPQHKPGDAPPSSPKVDHSLDADAATIASHNSALSAAIRAAPVHDLLNPRKLKHLCEEVRAATSEAGAAAAAAAAAAEAAAAVAAAGGGAGVANNGSAAK
jgi:hypothetical protein